ncbi:hypothetical protein [Methylophilus sp. TWE2]|uniref:hypothetical protein n=1 Tax=Methylophilus sp. TWE2 TaxID=1662285 RepID=UPI00067141F2|nr:hypothetical protein [Methylophilus sp. TWE2]AKR43620.1 hypothetical protein ACJ67_09415 [Methylophilus sp. TWE2]
MTSEIKDTAEQVIRRAEEILQTAQHGLDDLKSGNGSKRFSGLQNLLVFGRSVTFVIQNLRSVVEDFDQWYNPIQEELRSDEVMKYFVELRNQILKQGRLQIAMEISSLSLSTNDLQKLGTPPPGTKGFFIGDKFGGSGWTIELPDGSEAKYYVELPRSIAEVKQVFAEVPESARAAIEGKSVEELGEQYLAKLGEILDSCRKQFLGAPAQKIGGKRLPPYLRIIK